MPQVVFIIAQQDFRDEELLVPQQILAQAKIDYQVASLTIGLAHGKLGAVVTPDIAIKDIDLSRFRMVSFIGGPGALNLWTEPDIQKLLVDIKTVKISCSAICIAPVLLARAQLLVGKHATVYPDPEAIAELRHNQAIVVDKPVVIDNNIITASGPKAAEAFAQAIINVLKQEKV